MDTTNFASDDSDPDPDDDTNSDSTHDFSEPIGSSEPTTPLDKLSSDNRDSPAERSPAPKFERLGVYRIDAQIGRGGMGEVYLATEQGLDRQVALKVLPAAARISRTQVKRFLLEAKAAAQLSHDHIVPIYHIGEHEGIHYFTMRYIEGNDLSQIIRCAQRAIRSDSRESLNTKGPPDTVVKPTDSTVKSLSNSASGRIDLSTDSFVDGLKSGGSRSTYKLAVSVALIGQAVAEALHHAHQHGIVHRDIKPSNLMLDHSHKIWVTDFGLAQLQDAPALTVTGDILGTLRYMSPEQATGRRAFIDHRTDIYSLGVTLYELATLQRACRGESAQEILRSITFERPQPIRKINPKLPRDLETIICKATERNPSDRYQSAEELAADLRRFANNESLQARRPGLLKKVRDWAFDRPTMAVTMFLSLIAVCTSLAITATVMGNAWHQEKQNSLAIQRALETREGQNLLGMGSLLREVNPGLGLSGALAGADVVPGVYAERVVMDIADGLHELRTMRLNFDYPGKCEVSSDGSTAVLCIHTRGFDKSKQVATLVDLPSGKLLGHLDHRSPITSAAFLGFSDLLLTNSASSDGMGKVNNLDEIKFGGTKLWNFKSREMIKEFPANQALRISNDNYSRVNQQLVIPNSANSATVYNLPGLGQAMVLPRVHQLAVLDCKFSPDGTTIATWSMDGTAVLWDARTGQKLWQYMFRTDRPAAAMIAFTRDSKQLCLSSNGGTHFVSCADAKLLAKRSEQMIRLSPTADLAFFFGPFRSSIFVVNTQTHLLQSEFQFDGFIDNLTTLANDRYLAAVQEDQIVVLDLHSGIRVSELKGHSGEIESVAAISNTNQLISFAWDGSLRLWDVYNDLQRRTIPANLNASQPFFVRPNTSGSTVLIGSIREQKTIVYNSAKLAEHTSELVGRALLRLADGQVITHNKQELVRWELATQRRTAYAILSSEPDSNVEVDKAIELSPGGTIAILTNAGRLYYWKPMTSQLVQQSNTEEFVGDMVLDHSGQKLLLGLNSGELLAIDCASGLRTVLTALPGSVTDLDLHPDRNELLASLLGSQAIGWDIDRNQKSVELSKPGMRISEARFVSGDRIVTHGSWNAQEIVLWDKSTGQIVDTQSAERINEFAVSPDRKSIAAAADSGAYFWDLEANKKTTVVQGMCKTLAFESGKLVIATGSYAPNEPNERLPPNPAELIVWNPDSQQPESTVALAAHVAKIHPLESQGQFLASIYSYGVDYIDLKSNASLDSFTGHLQAVLDAAFVSNEGQLITVSEDGLVLLHHLPQGKHVLLGRHEYPITHARFSTDMQLLVTADQVTGIRLWNLNTMKLAKEIPVDGKPISRLTINSGGNHLLIQLGRNVIKLVDLRTDTTSDFDIAAGIRNAALSPDGKFVLIATGDDDLTPSHRVYTEDRLTRMNLSPVILLDVHQRQETKVLIDGFPIACQFLDRGQQFATLSSLGIVQVFDTQSQQEVSRLLTDRRIMQLLDAPTKSQWLFTTAKNQICAWNPITGTKVQELKVELSESQAALRLPRDLLLRTAGDFYVLGSDAGVIKRPINSIEYAKKIAPQQLTTEERQNLLNSMQAK